MKESISDVVIWLSKNESKTVQDAIAALGLKAVSGDELEALVSKVLSENRNLVKERGEAGFGIIMGILMKDLRGKVDAARVSKVLKEKLNDV
jgi:glutamyl-tRNA(Gln) amidotransferase subunit E